MTDPALTVSASPFYLNWEFWTVVMAFLAIVLSQLPPVVLWFRPKRLEIEVHSRLVVTHKVGNPNLSLFLSLRNIGGRRLWIQEAQLDVWRDGIFLGSFPAQAYFASASSNDSILFTPFALSPDEAWAHVTNFLRWFDRNTEKAYRAAESALRADIQIKLRERPENDKNMVVAGEQLVKPFLDMFQRLYVWEPGEYKLRLSVSVAEMALPFSRNFRFTLFESDATRLKSYTDDYKFGGGLAYNSDQHVGIGVPLVRDDG
ncbi:MAG: hypothetical protein AB7P24_18520 [Nitrospira sp.]